MNDHKLDALNLSALNRQGSARQTLTGAHAGTGPATDFDRWLVRTLLNNLGDPPFSIVLWDGQTITPPGVTPQTRVLIGKRNAIYKLLIDPELEFGDLYSSGTIEVEGDLVRFLETGYDCLAGRGKISRWLSALRRRPRANTLSGSRHNTQHHYDIGNAFYELWLDKPAMQYSCAYFPDPAMSLEEAQVAKMHHVCRKLGLRSGQTVVEAGCGWGGLARFMAKHYGVTVKAYNIAHEQVTYAREHAAREGLGESVEYIEDDYRNIRGNYDVFVSIGMLEHVGPEQYRELGGVIDRTLKDRGFALIHTMGRNREMCMNPWIEKRIFPGAIPPTLRQMMDIFEPWAFSIIDIENLRLHYAKTLEHWLARFEDHLDEVRSQYDESFIRPWRLYLAGSIAAFTTGSLQLFQIVFTRPKNNELPWSRAHLYKP
ncbi:MAG: cyclopropane-fatty-acyl-phospholipid synthase family protein [Gammaproteobacteria bacterium]|nr:cyclopropane-fatty-acyl-phospholipid synthase family protein [Gammaproteobacteria bacterium]MCI0591748.1 cyclopropane-fatty-acyl-phospholipid synthase family protein [Gammaproteobacteria bacterium]